MRERLRVPQSLFAEMLCTFIFGYTVYCAVANTKVVTAPVIGTSITLAICFVSIAIIYTFLDHTVCHFNPAITLAAILTLKLDIFLGIGFILAQLVGFILAALMVVATFPGDYSEVMDTIRAGGWDEEVTNTEGFFAEFTLTAILVFVAFEVAVNARRNPEQSLYGDEELPNRSIVAPLTIGLTLGFLSVLATKTTGSVFNPGLTFAPMLLSNTWPHPWQYFVAQFTGGLFGALVQVWLLFK